MNPEILWSLLVKGSLLVVLAAVASGLMRRTSAARRHVAWTAAVVTLLLLPLAGVRLPNLTVSADQTPMASPLLTPTPLRHAPRPRPISAPETSPSPTHAAPTPPRPSLDWEGTLGLAWQIGVIVGVGWLGLGLARAAWLVRTGTPWPMETPGTRRQVRVVRSAHLSVPATTGVLRPVILLPEAATGWDAERLRMVLAHETAHVQRLDWVWQTLAGVACAVHFFNPLVWLAARQLRKESEFASDDFVLGLGFEPTRYAQELLDIARQARFGLAATVGMAHKPGVEGRLRSIIDARRSRKWVSGRLLGTALGSALIVATPFALLRVVPGAPPQALGQGKTLPPIPWVASRAVEPGVYLAQDGIVGLPNGFRVRLVGVGTEQGDLWDLKRGSLPDAALWRQGGVYWQGNTFHGWSHGSSHLAPFSRSFIVEVQAPENATVATTSELVKPIRVTELQRLNPSYAGGDDRIPAVEFKKNAPSYAIIPIGVPTRAETGTYRFGVAGSEWTTVNDLPTPFKGTPLPTGQVPKDAFGLKLGEEPLMWYRDASGRAQTLKLNGAAKLDSSLAQRVLLFDEAGKPIDLPDTPSWSTDTFPMYELSAEKFGQIARIVLQTTPYQWAEFRDVPLRPDYAAEEARRLDPGIRGTATGVAPGFSKRLANGVTVAVNAVTKAKLSGDNWTFRGQPSWRADGQVLTQGPKLYEFAREQKVWGVYPLVDIQIGYAGDTKDANTAVEALGEVNPKFWLKGDYPSSQPGLATITTSYLPGAKTGGIRVGVANGPWKTIASRPVNVAELPPVSGKEGNQERTGISMTLGEYPEMGPVATSARTLFVKTPLKNVAKRFVAVLKSGKEQPLIPMGHGMKSLEFFSLPARHGEFTENYNNGLLASDVREIRLQTRPYEWVEFTGIALDHR